MKIILPDGIEISEENFLESLKLIEPEIRQELDNEIIEKLKLVMNNKDKNEERI